MYMSTSPRQVILMIEQQGRLLNTLVSKNAYLGPMDLMTSMEMMAFLIIHL